MNKRRHIEKDAELVNLHDMLDSLLIFRLSKMVCVRNFRMVNRIVFVFCDFHSIDEVKQNENDFSTKQS